MEEQQSMRYARQIAVDEIGEHGQELLKKGNVIIVGAGGLGSAVGLYLTAAGCGRLTLIDPDSVGISNLNRQILYTEDDIGKKKADVARNTLADRNRDIEINTVAASVTPKNAASLLKGADAIVDCLDNFASRYVINQAAVSLNIPLIHGACCELRGQLMTIIPRVTPCLQCVFPRALPTQSVSILGSVAGTIGTLQATEVVKLLTGVTPLLTGKLLVYDSQHYTWDMITVEHDIQCPACGTQP